MGYSAEQALFASNPMEKPKHLNDLAKTGNEDSVRLSNKHVNFLKNDVRFLKKATDLKEVNSKAAEGRKGFANSTDTRRRARRELRNLSKDEVAKEKQQRQEDDLASEIEKKSSIKALGSESSMAVLSDSPTPALRPMFTFLLHNFGVRVCQERCQGCHKRVLPKDTKRVPVLYQDYQPPKDPKVKTGSSTHRSGKKVKHPRRPERVFCGHWYHWGCLDHLMTTPPFGKHCPECDNQLFHPDWSSDVKQLERDWAMKQTKARELDDVADSFGLDDEFIIR